jgi:hypothetical protein
LKCFQISKTFAWELKISSANEGNVPLWDEKERTKGGKEKKKKTETNTIITARIRCQNMWGLFVVTANFNVNEITKHKKLSNKITTLPQQNKNYNLTF